MFRISLILLSMCLAISSLADQIELRAQLEKAAGIYKDKSKTAGLEKTVLITACNHGFLNHLHNFKCFADRLGMKFLVISMDQAAHDYITTKTNMLSYSMPGEVSKDAQEFRSKHFNLITARKKEAVHDIMQLGYDVLFSDTDVAMIRDPLKYMIRINVDYVHSLNYMCTVGETWDFYKSKVEGNTGFYFVRANNNTINLWAHAFAAAPKHPRLDDQAVFWRVIRTSKDPPILPLPRCRDFNKADDLASSFQYGTHKKNLVSCALDTCVFSSGMISRVYVPEFTYETLLTNLKQINETICTLHANYISGNKKKMNRMKEYGLWLAEEDENGNVNGKCKEYVPYIPVT